VTACEHAVLRPSGPNSDSHNVFELSEAVRCVQDFGRHTSKRTFIQYYVDAVSAQPTGT